MVEFGGKLRVKNSAGKSISFKINTGRLKYIKILKILFKNNSWEGGANGLNLHWQSNFLKQQNLVG